MSDVSKKLEFKEIVRISAVLCLICAVVALILSFVNVITEKRIALNEENEKKVAMIDLFGSESIECTPLDGVPDTVDEIFSVTDNGTDLGYCVSLAPNGFGGGIGMMVAIGGEGELIGVRIVSHSETPGLGSRIKEGFFLSQFVGASIVTQDYDVISGSTISSRTVIEGVNTALEAFFDIFGGGVSN